MERGGWVYILAGAKHGTLYVGVTASLKKRIWEHDQRGTGSFVDRYDIRRLVYAERHDDIQTAIQREKTIKHWKRAWKVALIEKDNPEWEDLALSWGLRER